MAIFPCDDPTVTLATRLRLRPLEDSYSARFTENVKRNAPTAGASQGRDVWGVTKWTASMDFDLKIDDIELLMSFWRQYRVSGFYFFDFERRQIGLPGYDPASALGTSSGAPQIFTLPAKEVSGQQAYSNGVGCSSSLAVGTGSMGEDKLTTTGTSGQALTAAFLGRYRYLCEMPTEPMKRTSNWNRQRVSITVLEKF